ncbi:unnamed protein product [Cladocopium goreaui]|uniref:Sentrin-specific protease 8 n=1 Tax=Cladocopium goreaui TaxID=2562237 RepID=A0A9P1D2R3_9DINO|nr:unnamed protein product [Cladocopium goreaui]
MALVSWKTARITRQGLALLERGEWLTDEVMTFWLEYFSTAAPPDGLGQPQDVLVMDPVLGNLIVFEEDKGGRGKYEGVHWALLALARDGEELRGSYYDSMGTGNLHTAQLLAAKLAPKTEVRVAPAGKQQNACDCGVFALLFAEALCRDKDPKDVTQAQAEAARKHMASHIWRLAKP